MAEKSERQIALESLEFQQRFDAGLAKIDEIEGFDASLGVETSRPVEPWEVSEADDTTLANNSRYSPTPVRTIRQVISAAAVRYEGTSFVDFGSGKGRVLLVAAEYPFRRVIGVEFSNDLCNMARKNVERYTENSEGSGAIEIRCQDARELDIPDDGSLFYLYEPFAEAVAEQVLDNIEASVARFPREVVLCFVGAALLSVPDGRRAWSQVGGKLVSPDHEYFDARLYRYTGAAPGERGTVHPPRP